MEQLKDKIETTKIYVMQLLAEMGLTGWYDEALVEEYYQEPYRNTSNSYRVALDITDQIINQKH